MKYHLAGNDNNVFFNALCHFAIHFSIVFEHFITCLRVLVTVVLSEIFTWHIHPQYRESFREVARVFILLYVLLCFLHFASVYSQ